jgi:hypothetical protein
MKKIFCLFITLILICLSSVVFGADFRNVDWGMTKEEVSMTEDAKPLKAWGKIPNNILCYDINLFNYRASLKYNFINGVLTDASYGFIIPKSKGQTKTGLYFDLKKALIEKYGQPTQDNEVWANETYKNQPNSLEKHVSYGHVSLLGLWIFDQTVIKLECKQIKSLGIYIPSTTLHYYSKLYYESLQQPQPKSDTKNL